MTNTTVIFPVHRWIWEEKPINIYPHDACLPQDDKQKEVRKAEVERKRQAYIFKETVKNGPPQVKQI